METNVNFGHVLRTHLGQLVLSEQAYMSFRTSVPISGAYFFQAESCTIFCSIGSRFRHSVELIPPPDVAWLLKGKSSCQASLCLVVTSPADGDSNQLFFCDYNGILLAKEEQIYSKFPFFTTQTSLHSCYSDRSFQPTSAGLVA